MIAKGKLACGYVRMSTDEQTDSPSQQRAAIEKLAADRGYKIVQWYEDLGVSGDRTHKRPSFHKMLADAQGGDFKFILCWDQDRFGRFDSLEAGFWIYPLRQQGVSLVTVAQGEIDWADFQSRLIYTIQQEGKHQFLRDLSRTVTRGMTTKAQTGQWVSGRPPLGYVVGDDGRLKLGAPHDVDQVKRMIREYLGGRSLRSIAAGLREDKILSPKETWWTATGIRGVIQNPIYLGHAIWNQRTLSKYRKPAGEKVANDATEWVVVHNTHEALMTQDDFDRIGELLKSRKQTHSTPHKDGGRFVFGNLLRCGHCGAKMIASGENGGAYYNCYSYREKGGCPCGGSNRITQADMLRRVVDVLGDRLFTKSAVREAVRQRLVGQQDQGTVNREMLRELNSKIEKAERRLVEVSSDMVQVIENRLRELRGEKLALEMRLCRTPADADMTVEQRVDAAMKWFHDLQAAFKASDPTIVRQFLATVIDRIEVWMTPTQQKQKPGKRARHTWIFDRGVLYLNPDRLFGKVSATDQKSSTCSVRPDGACIDSSGADRSGTRTGTDSRPQST